MSNDPSKAKADVMKHSFEKETTQEDQEKVQDSTQGKHRSLMNAPVDPNSPTTNGNFPPGVQPDEVADPGRGTPDAAPVENRSGTKTD